MAVLRPSMASSSMLTISDRFTSCPLKLNTAYLLSIVSIGGSSDSRLMKSCETSFLFYGVGAIDFDYPGS